MRKVFLFVLLGLISGSIYAQNNPGFNNKSRYKEYHVSVNGSDSNKGSNIQPFKTISAAANVAMSGDVITVHTGVYREQITPPRGGNSENERITYQAAKGEKVEIKGSEIIKGWKKTENDTWVVKIPNSFFGKFNPYSDLIRGAWYWPPKGSTFHTGAVYLNGDWLMEALTKEDAVKPISEKGSLWWANVDSTTTTIWAQFKNVDPNKEMVEINVRQKVFYPERLFTNFITVRGFIMEQAATNWAPPTAEQMGLIGTNWSRGWIIENNTIQYSKCVGIALGKYDDALDNKDSESSMGYVGTINRALKFGWNKGTIGGHLVRKNAVAYCEQAGIVGSLGCAYSIVEDNTIHDIHVRKLFGGAEMGAIKFHGGVDVQVQNNHIYNSKLGIWLDWMGQGAQIKNNLLHDNDLDIYLEVNHGPTLLSNNIFLSKKNLLAVSSGIAFTHNLFAGILDVKYYDSRLTPYLKPHSTYVDGLLDNPAGDVQFINNLFVKGSDASLYKKNILPVIFNGNVYTKGAQNAISGSRERDLGKVTEQEKEKINKMPVIEAVEKNFIENKNFDAGARLIMEGGKIYLEIAMDKNWLSQQKRNLVTTSSLTKAIVTGLPFENGDGSPLKINVDYFGNKRNEQNPSPGPFEIKTSGKHRIQVYPVLK